TPVVTRYSGSAAVISCSAVIGQRDWISVRNAACWGPDTVVIDERTDILTRVAWNKILGHGSKTRESAACGQNPKIINRAVNRVTCIADEKTPVGRSATE